MNKFLNLIVAVFLALGFASVALAQDAAPAATESGYEMDQTMPEENVATEAQPMMDEATWRAQNP